MSAVPYLLYTMVVVCSLQSIIGAAELSALLASSDDDSSGSWPVPIEAPVITDTDSAACAISAEDLAAVQAFDSSEETDGTVIDLTTSVLTTADFQALLAHDSTSSDTDEECPIRKLLFPDAGYSDYKENDLLPCVLLPSTPDSTRQRSSAIASPQSCSGSTTETCTSSSSPGGSCSPRSPESSITESTGDDLPEDLMTLATRHMCFDEKVAKISTKRKRKYNRRSPSSERNAVDALDRPKSKKKVRFILV